MGQRRLNGTNMTMPHLENCQHSASGWCLDCVKAEHDVTEKVTGDLMVQCELLKESKETRFQHTQKEMSFISDMMAFLNKDNDRDHSCCFEGRLVVYWSDCVMGYLEKGDDEWLYFPVPKGCKPEDTELLESENTLLRSSLRARFKAHNTEDTCTKCERPFLHSLTGDNVAKAR